MSALTIVVRVEGLRRDFLDRTPGLARLAATSRVATVSEGLNALPSACYFAGLTPNQTGFSHPFCHDPIASPFGAARGLPRVLQPRPVDVAVGARQWVEAQARTRLPPYAAATLDTRHIPLDMLPSFDLVEKYEPWDERAPHRSVFHSLREQGLTFAIFGDADTTVRDDRQVVADALSAATPPLRLLVLRLDDLHRTGRKYGPESPRVFRALDELESLLSTLLVETRRRFNRVDLLLIGSHGLVSVTGTTDVQAALLSADLQPERDLTCFLGPTLARIWPSSQLVESVVTDALATLPGRFVTSDELACWQLDRRDPRDGTCLFLAHPGIVISPNFDDGSVVPAGVHGYRPACVDNHGTLLIHQEDATGGIDLGLLPQTAVFDELTRLLSLPAPVRRAGARQLHTALRRSPFTASEDGEARNLVAGQLSRIVDALGAAVPSSLAIAVTGSYGCDEGPVYRGTDGQPHPAEPYELLVIAPPRDDLAAAIDAAVATLEHDLAVDLHVTLWAPSNEPLTPTLEHFRVRHGSRVLSGDPAALDRRPRLAASELPASEAADLLITRLADLLCAVGEAGPASDPRHAAILEDQVMRAASALGDACLLRLGAYAASIRVRRERLRALADGLRVSAAEREFIDLAYQFALDPDRVTVRDVRARSRLVTEWMVTATTAAIAQFTRRPVQDPLAAADAYYEATTRDSAWVSADNAEAIGALADDHFVRVCAHPRVSVRQTMRSAVLLVAAAAIGEEAALARASGRLAQCLTPPWPTESTPDNWELVRGRLIRAWTTLAS